MEEMKKTKLNLKNYLAVFSAVILILAAINTQIYSQETDYNSTTIASGVFQSSATQTNQSNWPNPGRIWVASAQFKSGIGDTLRIYYSDNGGASFNLAYSLTRAGWNFDFRPGELDIELCYDGSTVWLFGVAGFNQGTVALSLLFRINTATNAVYTADLTWPGSVIGNLYYNPRITSDNSVNTATTQIFITCSFDSTYSGTQHYLAVKFCKAGSIFSASPVLTYTMPDGNRFGINNSTGNPANVYAWSDIGYTKTSTGDRIYTILNTANISGSFYYAFSDNYGSTSTAGILATGIVVNRSAKIAFNGGAGNYTGLITLVCDGIPYNLRYFNTTNSGTNWSAVTTLTSNLIKPYADVTAIRGVSNQFKIAYLRIGNGMPTGFYTGGSPGNFTQPNIIQVSPIDIDTANTRIIAGYVLGGGDDCFAVYSNAGGNNVIASRLCQTTVGVTGNNNQIPNEYRLEQNYPNPFNPATNIKFSIPKSSFVKLVVYDASGKEIETLVNSNLDAGNYSYDFNAPGLASGVYFYRLEAEGFTDTKKMILVK